MKRAELKDLNLVDSYLFSRSTENPQNAKFIAKIVIQRALGRIIKEVVIESEKPLQGISMENHGIRMDLCIMEYEGDVIASVYDIEPNKYDISELPRRSRYSQALTDVKLLSSGEKYKMLPEYISIWILTEDPFGENKMIYIVKNVVENNPEIEYNDGVTKMFLYVDGEGNGTEELHNLLQFFKISKKKQATDEELRQLHDLIEDVKQSPQERMRYMTWQDYIDYEKADARKEARKEGLEEGRAKGLELGREEGRAEGLELGREEGRKETIKTSISILRELNVDEEQILQSLVSKFQLTEDKAKEYMAGN